MTESPMWLAEPALQDEDESEATGDAGEAPVNFWAELPVAERLGGVLQRLRNEYSYCIFCGCQVHSHLIHCVKQGSLNPWEELLVAERLGDVVQRLRNECTYCIFCGCQVHCMTAPNDKAWEIAWHENESHLSCIQVDRAYCQGSTLADRVARVFSKHGEIDPRMKRVVLLAVCGHHRAGLIMPRPHGR